MSIFNKYTPSVFTVFCLLLSSCVTENAVPAYISIPNFTLTTTSAQGSAAQKITDAWVYVDGNLNGIFELPAKFPVADIGKHEFQVFAGIRQNGQKQNNVIYPFFQPYKTTLDLKAGETTTVRPTTTYLTESRFWLIEDFEFNNSFRIDRDNNPNLKFVNADNGFEGKSGLITLTKANPLMEKASNVKAQIPTSAVSTYIEFHYKTEVELSVGIFGSSSSNAIGTTTYKVTLFPNTFWNKAYLNMTQEIKDMQLTDFQVVFRSLLPDSLAQATILIDNVKLVQK